MVKVCQVPQDPYQFIGDREAKVLESSPPLTDEKAQATPYHFDKPRLPPPNIFKTYWRMEEQAQEIQERDFKTCSSEIECNGEQNKAVLQQRALARKEELDAKARTVGWSVAAQVFACIAPIVTIVAGIGLIASGVGALGGSLLLASGLLTAGMLIAEKTGLWKQIAACFPGEDPAVVAAWITWIQIGITVLSMILAGVGTVLGGFKATYESAGIGMALVVAIPPIAQGIVVAGKGVQEKKHKYKLATLLEEDKKLTSIKHDRTELMETFEEGVKTSGSFFEAFSKCLGYLRTIDRAHQAAWRNS